MRLTVFLGITLALLAGPGFRAHPPAKTRPVPAHPNVVFILADDLGYGDLSCYQQAKFKTPNIDRLAASGMRFTHHYAGATVCAPSRTSLQTGKHTGHTSVRGNAPAGQLLRPEETTIAEVFKKAGYTTALIGKWGVGHPPPPDDPARNGYDYAYGYVNMWHAHNYFPEFVYRNGQKVPLPGNHTRRAEDGTNPWVNMPEGTGVADARSTYVPDRLEQEALLFIDANRSKPFFLHLTTNQPHANNEGKGHGMDVPDIAPAFRNKDWPENEKAFATMVTRLDSTVGMVMAKIKALGLEDNTLIVFSSDNGPHEEGGHKVDFFDSNGPLRGTKRDLYEGGVRIPFIASWKGHIKPGTTTDHVAAFWDFLPTVCDLIGQPKPAGIDGISYLPTLLGTKGQAQHDHLYWEFYEEGGKQGVLYGPWKGIRLNTRQGLDKATFELYDLQKDPAEQTNVAANHPDVVKKIEAFMQADHQPFSFVSLFDNAGASAETPK